MSENWKCPVCSADVGKMFVSCPCCGKRKYPIRRGLPRLGAKEEGTENYEKINEIYRKRRGKTD